MTFIVTESCIKCKLTDCVEVCPVDCFHEGPNMLVIDPEECIDCTLCEPECPVEAIYSEDEIPEGQEKFLELNAELSESWPGPFSCVSFLLWFLRLTICFLLSFLAFLQNLAF